MGGPPARPGPDIRGRGGQVLDPPLCNCAQHAPGRPTRVARRRSRATREVPTAPMTSPIIVATPLAARESLASQAARPGRPGREPTRKVPPSLHLVLSAGDVLVRRAPPGDGPAFVLSQWPGPEQCGVATRHEATRLAVAYGAQAGVDVWIDGGHGPIRLARFRHRREHRPSEAGHRSEWSASAPAPSAPRLPYAHRASHRSVPKST